MNYTIRIIKTVKYGLEVYLVEDRCFLSEQAARDYVTKRAGVRKRAICTF
jgi:hypothetical protein